MKRIGAQFIYIDSNTQVKKGVLEISDEGIIQNVFSLENISSESANTEFFNGILAPAFVSISKDQLSTTEFVVLNANQPLNFPSTENKLIFDFQNSSLQEISHLLWLIQQKLPEHNIFDILSSCTYSPSEIMNNKNQGIQIGSNTEIWLFENIDLINKKFLSETSIRIV